MDLEKQFATDKTLELEGVWQEIGEDAGIRLARIGNPRYTRVLRAKIRGKERQLQLRTLPDDVTDRLYCEALAEAVLLDWRGFTRDGEALPYSREAAVDVLLRLKDFRDLVVSLAEGMELFQREADEDAEKNSPSSSASSSRPRKKTESS